MAFFGVTIERIATSRIHPNADRLSICTLKGMDFQFVTEREEYRVDDEALYFPLDCILPANIIAYLELEGKLAGPELNRVKTIILRGEISQGLVAPPGDFLTSDQINLDADNLAEVLGVRKYNPVPNHIPDGILMPLPTGNSAYDIEGADRYLNVVDQLMDEPVQITEKIEGANFSITRTIDGEVKVNTRENTVVVIEGSTHVFWATARNEGLIDQIAAIQEWVQGRIGRRSQVTLYGEIVGPGTPERDIYKLPAPAVFAFDLRHDRGYMDAGDFEAFLVAFPSIRRSPLLSVGTTLRDWLKGRTVKEASTGQSLLNPKQRREGIVIKPMKESRWSRGRLIIKQRCPVYLGKQKD
jgi:RNA ligase (TIGR02306 family)